MYKVTFIINSSRKLSAYASAVLELSEHSQLLDVAYAYTSAAKRGTPLTLEATKQSDIIVAVGGDGTCNEVVQGIYLSGKKTLCFAIVPNGTGNDFVRNLPHHEPEDFVRKLEQKDAEAIDIGYVTLCDNSAVFLNIADIGFGAKVVELMNRQRRRGVGGKFSYSLAILRAFFAYRKSVVTITSDEYTYQGKVLLVAFCNGPVFGHGLNIHPEAKVNSGKLGVTIVGDVSLITYLRKLGDLKRGRKISHPEAHYFEASRVQIESLQGALMMEGDGELFGGEIQEVRILPGKLRLIR